jgi:hypothetical protein
MGAAAQETRPLVVTVTAARVQVANATPAGRVVLFTASMSGAGGVLRQRTGAKSFTDDDGDGRVVHVSAAPIPLQSIWIAFDVETGRYASAGPDGYPLRQLAFPANLLKKEAEGVLGVFDNELLAAEMVVVRPKVGAWRLVALEGAAGDADRARNGKLSLASNDALPVAGNTAAPKHLKNGDVIAVIDTGRMEYFIAEVGK